MGVLACLLGARPVVRCESVCGNPGASLCGGQAVCVCMHGVCGVVCGIRPGSARQRGTPPATAPTSIITAASPQQPSSPHTQQEHSQGHHTHPHGPGHSLSAAAALVPISKRLCLLTASLTQQPLPLRSHRDSTAAACLLPHTAKSQPSPSDPLHSLRSDLCPCHSSGVLSLSRALWGSTLLASCTLLPCCCSALLLALGT